jgi:hypothetical protein
MSKCFSLLRQSHSSLVFLEKKIKYYIVDAKPTPTIPKSLTHLANVIKLNTPVSYDFS